MNIGLHTAINHMELTTSFRSGIVSSDEEPVIDLLTGKTVPKCFIKVHRFIRASKQNREWVAYLAHKGTEDWPYRGMPLSTVITYLKWRSAP
jgi:hypothetical protein